MFSKPTSLVLAAALGAITVAAMAMDASAQTRVRQNQRSVVERYSDERPPLTVNRRSFLDPGPVVPVGSMSNYMTANTIFARTPDQTFAKSRYGNEVLPAPLEVPGRPQPILEFSTPRLD